MNISIRKSDLSDYDVIDEMLCKLHKYHVENRPDVYRDIDYFFSKEDYSAMLKEEENVFIISSVDNVICGMIWYRTVQKRNNRFENDRNKIWIDGVYVEPRYRKLGIGQRLVQEVIEIAKNDDIDDIDSMVWDFNEASKRLFDKNFAVRSSIMSCNIKKIMED